MTVSTVKAQLVVLQKQITGIKNAYAEAPIGINTSENPVFINLTGSATENWEALGDDQNLETRVYNMRLYVAPVSSGLPGEAERLCEPFFSRVRDFFAAHPFLGNLRGVSTAYVISDSGVTRFAYDDPNLLWIGIEFKLQVQEQIAITYVE